MDEAELTKALISLANRGMIQNVSGYTWQGIARLIIQQKGKA